MPDEAILAEIVEAAGDGEPQIVDDATAAPRGSPCFVCGAPIEASDRFCTNCGIPNPAAAAEDESVAEPTSHLRCENCGSEVSTNLDQRSYVCAFCGSTYVVEFSPKQTGRHDPEFVIGFAVTPEQAREKFSEWLRANSWFRPSDLKTAQVAEQMRGVYLPFWSFSMLAHSRWRTEVGEHWYRTETYTTTDSKGKTVTRTRRVQETEWWPLSGRHQRYYAGFLVSGSRGLPQKEAERIKPFNLPALKRYRPYYLAGWLCEEYSVEREPALRVCQAEFARREQEAVLAFLPGDTSRRLQVATNFQHVNSDLCLLPVYLLSYRYKDRVYRFLLNGQTGRMAGDKPISWRRILAAVAAGVGLLLLVALLVWWLVGA